MDSPVVVAAVAVTRYTIPLYIQRAGGGMGGGGIDPMDLFAKMFGTSDPFAAEGMGGGGMPGMGGGRASWRGMPGGGRYARAWAVCPVVWVR